MIHLTREPNVFKVVTNAFQFTIRDNEINITFMCGSNTQLPLLFFLDSNDKKSIHHPKNIQFNSGKIEFQLGDSATGNISSYFDNDCKFEILAENTKIIGMIPIIDKECYLGDSFSQLDLRFTTKACFNQYSANPNTLKLDAPLIYQKELAIACQNNNVDFNIFQKNTKQFINIETKNSLLLDFWSTKTQREALKKWYSLNPRVKRKIVLHDQSSMNQLQNTLYHNLNIIPPKDVPYITLEKTRYIQNALDDNEVNNCICGSLAMRLNGFDCPVNDIDIIVESSDDAYNALKDEFNLEFSSANKWKNSAFRIISPLVDISQVNKIDTNHCTNIYNIRTLNERGLLLMKLIGEFERQELEPNYHQMKIKNQENISLLLYQSPYLYPHFEKYLQQSNLSQLKKLLLLLNNAQWNDTEVLVTFPAVANVFKRDRTFLIPIINTGHSCEIYVTLNSRINSVIWNGWNVDPINCEIISKTNTWTKIQVPSIMNMGVLICQEK